MGTDPYWGVGKECQCLSSVDEFWNLDDEWGVGYFAGSEGTGNLICYGTVAYGTEGHFAFDKVWGTYSCDNGYFGDPHPGQRKNCYCNQYD